MLFVGRLKTIEHAMEFSLLFIYYLLFYSSSKPEAQDLIDHDLGPDLEPDLGSRT